MTTLASRYGTIPYGAYYYGSTGTETVGAYLWGLEVDWDGDGVFDGTNEAGRLLEFQCDRGRKNWLQPSGQGLYPLSVGVFNVVLDNYDGRYDAWNTSSPLYPNVSYGRDVRIKITDTATSTTYPVFYGIISDIIPFGYGANSKVKIKIEDGLRYLQNTYSNYYTAGAASQPHTTIIGNILDSSGWLSRWGRNINLATGYSIYYISSGNLTAAIEINDIMKSIPTYKFFVSASGVANAVDGNTGSVSIDQTMILKDIGNPFAYLNYRSNAKIYYSTYGSTSRSYSQSTSTPALGVESIFMVDSDWVQSVTDANAWATVLSTRLNQRNKTPVIQIQNRANIQFMDLFDTVTLDISDLDINSEAFHIGGIEHHGTPQEIKTVYYLEPVLN